MTTALTPILTAFWDHPQSWQLATYEAHDGYRAWRKALGMAPADIITAVRTAASGSWRRRLPDRNEVVLHEPARRWRALPGRQRRRVRAGHLQRHPAHDGQPACPHRGRRDLRLRDRLLARLRLSARRGRPRLPAAASRRRGGPHRRAYRPQCPRQRRRHGDHHPRRRGCLHLRRGDRAAGLPRGRRGQPRLKPPFPGAAGLYARPTSVNNVESIASVPGIVLHGADWFKSMGTEKSTGFGIFSLSGHVRNPGQFEAPLGITMRELIELAGGMRDPSKKIKFWTPGGSSTRCSPTSTSTCPGLRVGRRGRVDARHPRPAGLRRDHLRGPSRRPVDRLLQARVVRQVHPAGRAPGGSSRSSGRLERGEGSEEDLGKLLDICDNILGRSFCPLGDGATSCITSSIQYFRDEYLAHLTHGGCPFDRDASSLFAKEGASV